MFHAFVHAAELLAPSLVVCRQFIELFFWRPQISLIVGLRPAVASPDRLALTPERPQVVLAEGASPCRKGGSSLAGSLEPRLLFGVGILRQRDPLAQQRGEQVGGDGLVAGPAGEVVQFVRVAAEVE